MGQGQKNLEEQAKKSLECCEHHVMGDSDESLDDEETKGKSQMEAGALLETGEKTTFVRGSKECDCLVLRPYNFMGYQI